MLTTEQILCAKFTPVTKGAYSADEVDAFVRTVADSYENSLAENKELIKKISILADKIESYRKDEEAIKLSLLDAHRMAENVSKTANEKADAKIEEAELKAKVIVDGATRQSSGMIDEAREKAKEIVDNARVAVASLTERAQNETEQAITAAQQKAVEIVNKAEAQAREILGKSKADYEFYTAELARIKKETASFKDTVEALCKSQLKLLDSIDAAMNAVAAPEAEVEAEEIIEEAPVVEEAIPEIIEEPVIEEAPEETVEEEIAEEEEILEVPDFEEIAAQEPSAPEFVMPAFADTVAEAVAEARDEEAAAEESVVSTEDDDDDLFSVLEEINFDDITTPADIPASIDNVAPVAEPAAPAQDEEIVDIEDDDFEGFQLDLDSFDSLITDTSNEEKEIESFFSGLFDN